MGRFWIGIISPPSLYFSVNPLPQESPKEKRERENIVPWSLGQRKPRTAVRHQGTRSSLHFGGSQEGARVQAPPQGSASRPAPGTAVWSSHPLERESGGPRAKLHTPDSRRPWRVAAEASTLCFLLSTSLHLWSAICIQQPKEEADPHFTAGKTEARQPQDPCGPQRVSDGVAIQPP